MRNSVISSSVSTIVAKANDRLVAAGVAMRTFLNHTSMREQHCGWHEPNVVSGCGKFIAVTFLWQRPWSSLKRFGQHAYALCPAYAAITRVAPRG
jgi:hypothetical protein